MRTLTIAEMNKIRRKSAQFINEIRYKINSSDYKNLQYWHKRTGEKE